MLRVVVSGPHLQNLVRNMIPEMGKFTSFANAQSMTNDAFMITAAGDGGATITSTTHPFSVTFKVDTTTKVDVSYTDVDTTNPYQGFSRKE